MLDFCNTYFDVLFLDHSGNNYHSSLVAILLNICHFFYHLPLKFTINVKFLLFLFTQKWEIIFRDALFIVTLLYEVTPSLNLILPSSQLIMYFCNFSVEEDAKVAKWDFMLLNLSLFSLMVINGPCPLQDHKIITWQFSSSVFRV